MYSASMEAVMSEVKQHLSRRDISIGEVGLGFGMFWSATPSLPSLLLYVITTNLTIIAKGSARLLFQYILGTRLAGTNDGPRR